MWSNIPIVFLFKIFICLAALGLSCSKWDLVPWPGIKLESPALECSLKATGSSPKFCSLVFVYYSEFLVWVRKISPSFLNLAICFKYFFSVWILLIQIEGILFGTLLNSHMNVIQWGKNWINCPPYSLQDPMWAVTVHLSISLPVLLWPQASLEFVGFLQYSTFLSGRTLQILSSLCPELSSAIHHLWAPSHHSCFIWNITAERSALCSETVRGTPPIYSLSIDSC